MVYRVEADLPEGKFIGRWTTYDPWEWFCGHEADLWDWMRNRSGWCADSAQDIVWLTEDVNVEKLLDDFSKKHGCRCAALSFQLETILDSRFHRDITGEEPRHAKNEAPVTAMYCD